MQNVNTSESRQINPQFSSMGKAHADGMDSRDSHIMNRNAVCTSDKGGDETRGDNSVAACPMCGLSFPSGYICYWLFVINLCICMSFAIL